MSTDPRPQPQRDYPANFTEFIDRFHSEAEAWSYLAQLRWPDGFSCPGCGSHDAWLTKRYLYVCADCRRQTSLTVGTVFEGSRLTLRQWLHGIWLMAADRRGLSARGFQETLGIKSYKTAWLALHKIRRAMVRTSPDLLNQGVVEVDEFYVGGPSQGKPGRSTDKHIVLVAVERLGYGRKSKRVKLGRCRMRFAENTQRKTLHDFISDVCEPGAIIHTDGKKEYQGINGIGYKHIVTVMKDEDDPAHVEMPACHRVASLVKRWLLGTHHGGFARQHLDAYLDEYTFRFNRRLSRDRGLIFFSVVRQCLNTRRSDYEAIVLSQRGLRGRVRGPAPGSKRQPSRAAD